MRYDPVWRRIKPDAYSNKLGGAFPQRLERLELLNNWGGLSWLHPHAVATKREHHHGVERNAIQFVADDSRKAHRASFRAATHIMHWGHLPLSYQGEEGFLRAAHVKPAVSQTLRSVMDAVVDFGDLDCATADHEGQCVEAVLNGERPFDLYRWFAALDSTGGMEPTVASDPRGERSTNRRTDGKEAARADARMHRGARLSATSHVQHGGLRPARLAAKRNDLAHA